jgi:NTP pyrophosphatase (non-canonical NTP hydrolase)
VGSVPPYAIGSETWPGLAKLAEECGELLQVIGKVMAYPGGEHPDGTDIVARLHDELGDVIAAADYVIGANEISGPAVQRRAAAKLSRFDRWHLEEALGD